MPEICIDVPAAYNLLEAMGNKMYQLGVLSEALYKDLPARSVIYFIVIRGWQEGGLSPQQSAPARCAVESSLQGPSSQFSNMLCHVANQWEWRGGLHNKMYQLGAMSDAVHF